MLQLNLLEQRIAIMEVSAIKSSLKPPVIAHRGASAQAPENTLAAFAKAKQFGLNWVEFDVMLAATGDVVVIHDDDLERTTNGKGRVIDSSFNYLQTLDAGSWFNPTFANERIPQLQQLLKFLHSKKLAANLEIKSLPGYEQATVQKVFQIIQASMALPVPLLLSSFSLQILRLIRKASASVLLGMLMDEWQTDWHTICDELQCVTLNVNESLLNAARVAEVKSRDYVLLTYTVNTIERAQELLSWGVDAVFSDCPQTLLSELNIKGASYGNE